VKVEIHNRKLETIHKEQVKKKELELSFRYELDGENGDDKERQ
jgi:hypothetical protein